MNDIIQIWDSIVKSNTFNFIIMLLILVWIVRKINLKATIESSKNNIIKSIENSKAEKENGILTLKEAEKSVSNLEEEISTRLETAQKQADDVEKNILNNANNKLKQIEENISKVIENEEKQISTKLTIDTAKKSTELAKEKIIQLLENNPKLHEKYIDESLEEIDRIKL